MSVIFRCLAYVCANADVACNLGGPITVVFQQFAGFLITWDKIPVWLQWVAWITPFSWSFRSLALSEFHDEGRYPDGLGDTYLDVWQVNTNDKFKFAAIGFNLGLFLLFVVVSAAALSLKRAWLSVGTRRSHDESAEALSSLGSECGDTSGGVVRVRVGARSTSMREEVTLHEVAGESSGLEFTRMDLRQRPRLEFVFVSQFRGRSGMTFRIGFAALCLDIDRRFARHFGESVAAEIIHVEDRR